MATGYLLINGHGSSNCSLAVRRALLLNCCCSLYAIIALLASHLFSLLIASFGVRCTLIALHCSHLADYSLLVATTLFAVRCWLLAVCFPLFGFDFSLLSCRVSFLDSMVLAEYYLLLPARYYLLATHGPTVASVL